MLYVLMIFGLIGAISPEWFMSCLGLGSILEGEGCIVGFFRCLGIAMVGISLWVLFARH